MGITASTPTNLVVGAGNLLKAEADLGASEDANLFKIDRTYFTPDLNGSPGGLVGTDYIQSEEGTLESSLPEVSEATLGSLWPGSAIGTGAGDTDWPTDAINLGSISASADDKATMKPRLELHSRWDPADLTVSPHGFRITAL
jgi:hypothetical protein